MSERCGAVYVGTSRAAEGKTCERPHGHRGAHVATVQKSMSLDDSAAWPAAAPAERQAAGEGSEG